MCVKPKEYHWFCAFYRCNQPLVFCFSSTAFGFEQWRRRLRCFFLNFVVCVFEVSRGPFRNFVFGWTSDGEVSRGWFRLLVFEVSRGRIRNLIFDVQKLDWTSGGEVSRGRIRNLIFDVQKLDWTSGGEVSRGWFRILCVYDFRIPHQVRKALGRSRRKSHYKGGVSRGREERYRRKVCSIRKR